MSLECTVIAVMDRHCTTPLPVHQMVAVEILMTDPEFFVGQISEDIPSLVREHLFINKEDYFFYSLFSPF